MPRKKARRTRPARATKSLAALEKIVASGVARARSALLEIRDRNLYRDAGFRSFSAYLEARWRISRIHGYRLVEAARVEKMLPVGNVPKTERQLRELTRLPADQTRYVWKKAQQAFGSEPTSAQIRAIVQTLTGQPGQIHGIVQITRMTPGLPPPSSPRVVVTPVNVEDPRALSLRNGMRDVLKHLKIMRADVPYLQEGDRLLIAALVEEIRDELNRWAKFEGEAQ